MPDPSIPHPGLWLDKLCLVESLQGRDPLGDPSAQEKKDAASELITASRGAAIETARSRAMHRREHHLAALGDRALPMPMETASPLAIGLGNPSALDNGFQIDWATGAPVVPGSSIKGAVRAWALTAPETEVWEGYTDLPEEDRQELLAAVFGTGLATGQGEVAKDGSGDVGDIIFLDALPAGPVMLSLDVLTPHAKPYYDKAPDQDEYPADWHDPVPITFAVVPSGVPFSFALVARHAWCIPFLGLARRWLVKATADRGIGAKTSAGYGRFVA